MIGVLVICSLDVVGIIGLCSGVRIPTSKQPKHSLNVCVPCRGFGDKYVRKVPSMSYPESFESCKWLRREVEEIAEF